MNPKPINQDGMILILPSEQARLSKRRASDVNKGEVILHALDSDVFAYCCQYTDWKTGDIGRKSALSYARIALALSEDIPRKPLRHLRTVSAKQVENSVNRLVKAHLFARQSLSQPQKNRLQLSRLSWCELLMAHDCRKNTDGRQLLIMLGDLLGNKEINNNHLQLNNESSWEQNSNADGIYLYNYLSKAETRSFRLSLTWQPDREFVDLFLQASGFTGKQIKKIWFGSYVQYWSGQKKRRTQRDWSTHFAKHMQGYLLNPQRFERLNGMDTLDEPTTSAKTPAKTLCVPNTNDGDQLQTWALKQGLPSCSRGMSTMAYYQLLCRCVEKKAVG